jgi:hypothetical protein
LEKDAAVMAMKAIFMVYHSDSILKINGCMIKIAMDTEGEIAPRMTIFQHLECEWK